MSNDLTIKKKVEFINSKADIISARAAFPKYRESEESDRKNKLFAELQYAALMDNQEINRQALTVIVGELENKIMSGVYSDLTWPEIRTAIRKGASGEYGDWFKINVRSVSGWLDGFIENNKATYRELARQKDKERIAQSGDWYLERVRQHKERILREREEQMAKENKV